MAEALRGTSPAVVVQAPVRLLVTGPRTWTDLPTVQYALLDARDQPPQHAAGGPMVLVHGDCPKGLDRMAAGVARQWRWEVEPHPADWEAHGKAAGFVRNAKMVDLGADLCLAFAMACMDARCTQPAPHLTHGTADCATRAKAAQIPVRWYTPR